MSAFLFILISRRLFITDLNDDKVMKNTVWVGLGVLIGIGVGLVLKISMTKREETPFYHKQYIQKGDFALRDTESAISRAEF